MYKKILQFTLLFIFLTPYAWSQSSLSIKDFARHDEFDSIKVSPDGKYIATGVTNSNGERQIVIIELSTKKITARSSFTKKSRPGKFYWVNKERLVITLNRKLGSMDTPISTGELFAVNADGSKKGMIFGYRATARSSEKIYAGATLLDLIKDDPSHILVSVIPYPRYNGQEVTTKAQKLNVYSGRLSQVAVTPIRGGRLLADHDLKVRLAIGKESSEVGNKIKVYYRSSIEDKWQILDEYLNNEGGVIPLEFTADNKQVYVLSNRHQNTYGLYLLNPENGEMELLSIHDNVDIEDIQFDQYHNPLFARYDPDKSEYVFFDQSPFKKILMGLHKAFPGKDVEPVNISWDGTKIALQVYSDTNSGDFYLFDTNTKKAQYLFSSRSWEDPQKLHSVKPVNFIASDGLSINGYLTQPTGQGPFPLVVVPHGGPHGVRDYWKFNSEVQLLANSGYSVLQVNYRGSGGYGKDFQNAGYGEWGEAMQQDLSDATEWAIDQGLTTRNRICIFGGSYGAYAALMGTVKSPDLYQCAIGYAGVYDLNMMFEEGDIQFYESGITYLNTVLGTDPEIRAQRSPVNHADKIKSAILLVHGKKDERAPFKQVQAMQKALKKANHPYQSLIVKKEGHGFFKQENRQKFYETLLNFLDKHIGNKKLVLNQ